VYLQALQLYMAVEEAIVKTEKEFKCVDWHVSGG
jgi:hypothetical protein